MVQGYGHSLWTAPWGHRIILGWSPMLWLASPGSACCSPSLLHQALTSRLLMISQSGSCWTCKFRSSSLQWSTSPHPYRSVRAAMHTSLRPSHSDSSSWLSSSLSSPFPATTPYPVTHTFILDLSDSFSPFSTVVFPVFLIVINFFFRLSLVISLSSIFLFFCPSFYFPFFCPCSRYSTQEKLKSLKTVYLHRILF